MGKNKKKQMQLPFRLNILFIFVFALFSLLILQLGVVQILNGEEAQQEINKTENTPSEKPVPRGKMYDRFGRIILDNEPVKSITYTPPKNGEPAKDRLDLAEKLSSFIDMYENEKELKESISERDKKEYWYLLNANVVQERLTEEEKDLDAGDRYKVELDKITEKDLDEIEWTNSLLNVIAIKKELDQAFELSPHVIKNTNITDKEYARVAAHLNELPGIDAAIDWNRKLVFDGTFSSYIGSITSADQGIPRENRDYYLTRGYSRNDRVGTSGLEQQYESVLRGRKEEVQYTTDNSGNVVGSETVVEGQRGNDLVLTIDMELQQAVDQIVQEELEKAIKDVNNSGYLEDALVALMDPQTGEMLSLSGVRYDRTDKQYKDQSYRVIYDAHQPGSAVKGATLLAGFDSGVVHMGESIYDKPMDIADTPIKSSWRNLGPTNDLRALEQSSNVYMWHISLRMADISYSPGDDLGGFDWSAFQELRNYYNQFGLGVETGIDLPYEATGVVGPDDIAGKIMDLAIGQYDTYTTLQLVQYVSTIANEGYRVRPHLVSEIRQPVAESNKLGPVVKSFNTEVLNKIAMDQKYIDRVQEGFVRVFESGTASGRWSSHQKYKVAGKTGTAENPIYENRELKAETENLTLVGYAPYDNPEVAFAIVVPKNGGSGNGQYPVHHEIGKRVIAKYFELKEERAANGVKLDIKETEEKEE